MGKFLKERWGAITKVRVKGDRIKKCLLQFLSIIMPIMDKSGNKSAINIKVMFLSECFSVSVIYNQLCVCKLCYVLRSHMWSLRQKTECIPFTEWAINPAFFHTPVSFNLLSHLKYVFYYSKLHRQDSRKKNKNYSTSDPQNWLCGTGPKVYSSAFPGLPTLTYHINRILCYL